MFFSVVIPTYNRAQLISKAIESVIAQTFTDWELIVVDDGSTDGTKELIQGFVSRDPRIRYMYQQNVERSAARNNGIKNAKGEYICFLDSDDYFSLDYLKELHNAISVSGFSVALFMGTTCSVNEKGEIMHVTPPLHSAPNIINDIFEKKTTLPSQAICCHRDILLNNSFDVRFSLWEDTHLWVRCLCAAPYFSVKSARVFILAHAGSTVAAGMRLVKIKDVNSYISAVNDLFLSYRSILPATMDDNVRINYIFSKYQLYIYQARVNKQYFTAMRLLVSGLQYFSVRNLMYFMSTFCKITFSGIIRISVK